MPPRPGGSSRNAPPGEPLHPDDDLWGSEAAAVVHLADEMLDHFLRDLEIGDEPSRNRRIAWILPGVRPSISFAFSPTARTCFLPLTLAIDTTDGSFSTMPRPFT